MNTPKVEQVDREAAVALADQVIKRDRPLYGHPEDTLAGRCDATPFVQAFARHRLASSAREDRLDIDALAEEVVSAANIVSCAGFYEADTAAVARVLRRALLSSGPVEGEETDQLAALAVGKIRSGQDAARGGRGDGDQPLSDPASPPDTEPMQHNQIATDVADTEARAREALRVYNGGLIDVPDEVNERGYTTRYKPLEAMKRAIAAALASGRGEVIEECARVAEQWCGSRAAAGTRDKVAASIAIASAIRNLGKSDG